MTWFLKRRYERSVPRSRRNSENAAQSSISSRCSRVMATGSESRMLSARVLKTRLRIAPVRIFGVSPSPSFIISPISTFFWISPSVIFSGK